MSYKLVKVFETENMPGDIFSYLFKFQQIVKDGTAEYTVGFFAQEARKDGPDTEGYRRALAADSWFLGQGAVDRETVLVHHGTFNTERDYLFDD